MIICCDLDNCLNDLTTKTLALYNQRYNRNLAIESLTTYEFSRCLDPKDADDMVALFTERSLWDSLRPLSDAQRGLKALVEAGHDVYVATATLPANFPWKCDWMRRYFPFVPTDHIIRINHKGLLKVDVIIDDCMDNLVACIADRICLDYPWNRDSSKDFVYDIFRCKHWNDIANAIKNIEKRNNEDYE